MKTHATMSIQLLTSVCIYMTLFLAPNEIVQHLDDKSSSHNPVWHPSHADPASS